MKLSVLFVALVGAASPAIAATCNADNCARAATGTRSSLASARSAACSSFQACTVTPGAVTVTSTTTVAAPPPSTAVTQCGSTIPSFASACMNTSRYASACSCAGIAQSYSTATAPTVTTVVTVTAPALATTLMMTTPAATT